ncbi:MAG: L-seryl-tRNA(Sec) selenium transferase, partial [Actinomycetota bacterium]|nr:L-seryl-tRNA(Sec) selenium transferase [Actinomycetota bacterium]
ATAALPGAGSAPGASIDSYGVAVDGDHLDHLRAQPVPIIARARDGRTVLDLRTVEPADDEAIVTALSARTHSRRD